LFLFSISCYSQDFPSENIDTKDGLPNSTVFKIFKDSRGIIWVGTNNGLSKNENGSITNFFKEDGLSHNSIWDIVEDKKRNLWFATYGGGVTKFDGKKFTKFNIENGLNLKYIRKIGVYKNKILVGASKGLSIIDVESNEIEEIESGYEKLQIMDFFAYKNDIYCGTYKHGIFKIDIPNKALHYIPTNNYYNSEKIFGLFSIYCENELFYYGIDGGNLIGTKGALRKFNTQNLLTNKNKDTVFGKSIIWEYATDNENNLYGAAWGVHTNDGGVYLINENEFINMSNDFGVVSTNIRTIYYDKSSDFLYAGSLDKGYYKINLNQNIQYFTDNQYDIIDIEEVQNNIVFLHTKGLSIFQDDKIIHNLSSETLFDFAKENYSKAKKTEELFGWTKKKSSADIIFNDIVKHNDYLWLSTNIGVFQVNTTCNILNYYPILSNKIDFDFKGGLINSIPYRELLIHNDLTKGIVTTYPLKHHNTPRDVSEIVKSKDKIYLASAFKGLYEFENGEFELLNKTKLFEERELNHLAITKDSSTLLISSISGDVYLADITKKIKLKKKINKNLIVGNSILFLETFKNSILIGTEKGLNIFTGDKFQLIDKEQGLNNSNFTSSKIIEGFLIIGTDVGYYKLKLNQIINPIKTNLELAIKDLTINNQLVDNSAFTWFNYNNKQLQLQYNENRIEMEYNVSSQPHPYPNKLLFSYQLKGLDTVWSKFSHQKNISIPYIPSGKFEVNVRIKDLNSGITSTSKLVTLIIHPPFWETWWFIISMILALLLFVFFVYKKRISYITKREQQKAIIQQRIVETKLEALQSQMNPHFTFNAMNSIQNYIIDNDIDNALMYLGEFAKLIRKTLDNSSQPYISLAEEISYLKSYIALENMRYNNKVEICINYENIEIQEIDIPPMLIQPFVENVFVHAFKIEHNNPKLLIEFSIKDDLMNCVVEDNGAGMSETASGQIHQSKGMKLVSERLNLLNKSSVSNFEIQSEMDKGTSVILKFQLNDNY